MPYFAKNCKVFKDFLLTIFFEYFIFTIAATNKHTKKTAFLSSELHLYRAGRLAKDLKFDVTSLPAESPSGVKVKNYLREAFILMYMDAKKLGGRKNG